MKLQNIMKSIQRFRMQYVSDLHLEFFNKMSYIQVRDSILDNRGKCTAIALLGDIGDPMKHKTNKYDTLNFYKELINDLAPHYNQIFVIAGNHEFYSGYPMDEVKKSIEEICDNAPGQVYFMDNKMHIANVGESGKQVAIIGTTLWSHIPAESVKVVERGVEDYRKIQYGDEKFTANDSNHLHQESLEFINKSIKSCKSQNIDKILILSHHAPRKIQTLAPKYEGSDINSAFVNDLDSIIKAPIRTWLFGHTHYQTNYKMYGVGIPEKGIRIASNPLGYRSELRRNDQEMKWRAHVKF